MCGEVRDLVSPVPYEAHLSVKEITVEFQLCRHERHVGSIFNSCNRMNERFYRMLDFEVFNIPAPFQSL